MIIKEVKHGHLFGALGGGAKGFNRGQARVGNMVAKFRCVGSIDVDAAANRDFKRNVGVEATTMDLFDLDQYLAFWGRMPPPGWKEATPVDIRRAMGGERPNIWFLSAPCKGFSGLLAENKSKTDKYQALNRLTLRGVFLALEAFKDDPVELLVFENVPRIATRGRHLLDQIVQLLQSYGYAVAETTHDCGELGGLAQSRKRFLLVARHIEKVPPFLYEPEMKTLKSVGSILERMPLPGDLRNGPMHRIPALQWKTWVRLAFVEAGSDWRSLNKLAVEEGYLKDYFIVPEMHGGMWGVRRWEDSTGVIAGKSLPNNGAYALADPRSGNLETTHKNVYRVVSMDSAAGTVTTGHGPSSGGQSVADPRAPAGSLQYQQYGVMKMKDTAGAIIGVKSPGQGTFSVADPRPSQRKDYKQTKYRMTAMDEAAGAVIAASTTGNGAYAVADPRTGMSRSKGDNYLTGGHYGVVPWGDSAGAVSASAGHDNGRWSVADPRLPEQADKLICRIRALDGTWHRPFTTLELAALQSLVEPEEFYELDGLSDQAWRERIGNAVPPAAAEAIAGVMGTTLLLAWSGETFMLNAMPIWVQPVAVAMAVAQNDIGST